MAFRYSPSHALLNQSSQVLGASVSSQPVSSEFRISYSGSKNLLIGIKCSGVTAGAGISLSLQSSIYGQLTADWQPAKSVSVSANGWAYIRLNVQNAADQAVLPLGDVARVVATTGVGSAIQIDDLLVVQGI